MNKKKKIDFSTLIAFVALFIASLSLYFQFFWKKHEICVFHNANIGAEAPNFEFIIFNTGNQDIVLKDIYPILFSKNNEDANVKYEYTSIFSPRDRNMPRLLKVGDTSVVNASLFLDNYTPSSEPFFVDYRTYIDTGIIEKVNVYEENIGYFLQLVKSSGETGPIITEIGKIWVRVDNKEIIKFVSKNNFKKY